VADFEFRTIQSSVEWQLRRDIFLTLTREVYQYNVDLFATHLNQQLRQFVSWRPNPFAMGTDALQIPWMDWVEGIHLSTICPDQQSSQEGLSNDSLQFGSHSHGIQHYCPCWWTTQCCCQLKQLPFWPASPSSSGRPTSVSRMDTIWQEYLAEQEELHSYCSPDGARATTQHTKVPRRSGSAGACQGKFHALSTLS